MGNMSYCRFQNTLSDLEDCAEKLGEIDKFLEKALSEEEFEAAKYLLKLCKRIADDWEFEIENDHWT